MTTIALERSRVTVGVVWALQILSAAVFMMAGVSKLAGVAAMVQMFDLIGVGQWFRYLTGGIEVVGAILLLIPTAASYGAAVLALTMVGAVHASVHRRRQSGRADSAARLDGDDRVDEKGRPMSAPVSLLFSKTSLGPLALQNHLVMAPMTRSRAIGNVPNELMVEYYAQRASAGLIVTEGTSPSPNGLGYARIPGIFSAEQVAGWKRVTDAVHARGGKMFLQLMHVGRIGHPLNLPAGARLLAPSAVAATGDMFTDAEGMKPFPVPHEMTEADIKATIEEFALAARNAVAAGFDGIELHGANGYLLEQFIRPSSNRRTDRYGGSIEGRARFVLEVVDAAINAIGKEKVGIRLSPFGVFNDMPAYPAMEADYTYLAQQLNARGLAYIHVVDHSAMGAPPVAASMKTTFRNVFKGSLILSGGYDVARAESDLAAGTCDLIAVGRPFLANPDLVTRWASGAEVTAPDFSTFYTPGPKGYTDYQTLG